MIKIKGAIPVSMDGDGIYTYIVKCLPDRANAYTLTKQDLAQALREAYLAGFESKVSPAKSLEGYINDLFKEKL